MSLTSLAAFKQRFVRARAEPGSPDYDASGDDTDSLALVCAIEGLDNRELICAACGSPKPHHPCVVRSGKTKRAYGFALCNGCNADFETATAKVDKALAGREGQNATRGT